MPKFRKKPVVIEAVKWDHAKMMLSDLMGGLGVPECWHEVLFEQFFSVQESGDLLIDTMEGQITARDGDWIIRGVKGEFYPSKPDIFEQTYEPAE